MATSCDECVQGYGWNQILAQLYDVQRWCSRLTGVVSSSLGVAEAKTRWTRLRGRAHPHYLNTSIPLTSAFVRTRTRCVSISRAISFAPFTSKQSAVQSIVKLFVHGEAAAHHQSHLEVLPCVYTPATTCRPKLHLALSRFR
jgi:hypothetical protein